MATIAELIVQINETFLSGGSRTKAAPVRLTLADVLNSYINVDTGGMVQVAEAGYTTELTLSSSRAFAHKKYVDDKVSNAAYNATLWNGVTTIAPSKKAVRDEVQAIYAFIASEIAGVQAGDFTQGGDTFDEHAELGTNDVFDLLFRTSNTNRGGIDSVGKWMAGLTTPLADTHKSNKSQGNTSGAYAEQWTASNDSLLVSIRNDGQFVVKNLFEINEFGNIEQIGGSVARIRGVSGLPFFPDGYFMSTAHDSSGSGIIFTAAGMSSNPFAFDGRPSTLDNARPLVVYGTNASIKGDTFSVKSASNINAFSINDLNAGFGATPDYQDGVRVIFIGNATTAPTTNPSGGGIMYGNSGTLNYKTSSGANTLVAGDYQSKSANYTALSTDRHIDCTGGNTITLYTAVGNKGRELWIKNTGGGLLTLDGNGTETIDGSLTKNLAPLGGTKIVSNGTNWISFN